MSNDPNKKQKVAAYAGVFAATTMRNAAFRNAGVPAAQSGMMNLFSKAFRAAPAPIKATAIMGTIGYGALSSATGGGRVLFNEGLNAAARGSTDATAQRNASATCPFSGSNN